MSNQSVKIGNSCISDYHDLYIINIIACFNRIAVHIIYYNYIHIMTVRLHFNSLRNLAVIPFSFSLSLITRLIQRCLKFSMIPFYQRYLIPTRRNLLYLKYKRRKSWISSVFSSLVHLKNAIWWRLSSIIVAKYTILQFLWKITT